MRRSALCAVLCLACISSDVPCSSCTRGPALQLRGGGTELGSTAGKGHSSVFLEDAARRKADADAAHSVAEPPSERTPEEILRGAMLREQAAQSRQEAAKLSVAALRSKLRALGASDASMGACTEKSDLVDLLTSLENTAQVVRVRTESRGTDSFKMPKMAADIAEFVTSLEAPKSTGKAEGNRTWPSTSQVSAESMAAGTKKLADLGRPTDGQTSPQQPARQTSMTAERVADGAREGMEQEEQKDDDDVGEVLEEREGRSEDEEDLRAEGAHAAIDYGSRRVAVAANLYETRHLPDSQRLQRMEQWLKSRPITYLREQLTTHGIRHDHTLERWELEELFREILQDTCPLSGNLKSSQQVVHGDLESDKGGSESSAEARRHGLSVPRRTSNPLLRVNHTEHDREAVGLVGQRNGAYDSDSDAPGANLAYRWRHREKGSHHGKRRREVRGDDGAGWRRGERTGKHYKPWMYAELGEDTQASGKMLVHINDRLGCKTSVLASLTTTIRELKARVAAQVYKDPHSMVLHKASIVYRDEMRLLDYEIHDGFNLELSYKDLAHLS